MKRGYYGPRSAQVTVLPKTPAYMATGPGGWSHAGPWPYVQRVPLVFYGPKVIPRLGTVNDRATLADVAPTMARLLGTSFKTPDGHPLPHVVEGNRPPPRLILTVVWDGGGWDVLNHYPNAWPNLKRLMAEGVSFSHVTVGSSPSVTPATHTTLGTGRFPDHSGITDIPARTATGKVVDIFRDGASTSFLEVPTFAEKWDESTGNAAKVGMVAYEPWHLGMIGHGSAWPGGDKDDAAWLSHSTNDWTTNTKQFHLPQAIVSEKQLSEDLHRLDARDGRVDQSWRDLQFLQDRTHVEETPAFVDYQTWGLRQMIAKERYGADKVPDLLYTNYKQIDRNGHYYNMDSWEVRQSLRESDKALGSLVRSLDSEVGKGRWAMVVTADHGQQPDAPAVNGYAVMPRELKADLNNAFGGAFGGIVQAVWPTQVFLDGQAMRSKGIRPAQVARFLENYRLSDNTTNQTFLAQGEGRFRPDARVFAAAAPSRRLGTLSCGSARVAGSKSGHASGG
jgi:predicted AlkP superfamily pyrophosphatase or phosphodiesterase